MFESLGDWTSILNTGINAANAATAIGTAQTNANESTLKADANTTIAQTGLLNGLVNLAGQDADTQAFNQLQPLETEIAKQNAMTGAMSTAESVLNSALNQNNNEYQAHIQYRAQQAQFA